MLNLNRNLDQYLQAGKEQFERGQFPEANQSYKKAIEVSQTPEGQVEDGEPQFELGLAYQRRNEFGKAEEAYQKALKAWEADTNQSGVARALNSLGVVYIQLGQYSEAKEKLDKALKIRQEIGERFGEAQTYLNQGLANYYQAYYKQAFEAYSKSQEILAAIAPDTEDREREIARTKAVVFDNTGLVYNELGLFQVALEQYHNEALKIVQQIGDQRTEIRVRHNQGYAYAHMKNPERAKQSYKEALAIGEDPEINDQLGVGRASTNLAGVHLDLEEYDDAERCLNKASEIFTRIDDPVFQARVWDYLGNLYRYKPEPDYARAEEAYQKALGISAGKNRRIEALTLVYLGSLYQKKGEIEKAKQFLREAEKVFNQILQDVDVGQQAGYRDWYEQMIREISALQTALGIPMRGVSQVPSDQQSEDVS